MPTARVQGTTYYFSTDELPYPYPPSQVCASTRNKLFSVSGLTGPGNELVTRMMLEIEGMARGSVDQWIGFDAKWFREQDIPVLLSLIDHGLITQLGTAYFLSPALVS